MDRLQTSKTIHPSRLDGLVGQPADLTEWAYAYRRGAADNPPEAEWLWPGLCLTTGVPADDTP